MTAPLRLMLWHWGRHGGGPRYTYELAKAMKELPGVETHLTVSRQCTIADEFRELDLPTLWVNTYTDLVSCALHSFALPRLAGRLGRYVRREKIMVVNSTMTHLWTRLAMPAVRLAGARTICTVHDATLHPGERNRIKDWFYAPVPNVDSYVTLTNFVANRLTTVHAVPRDKITVVPHGAFTFGEPVAAMPPRNDDALRLLFLGRILPYKGLNKLLSAYETLRSEGLPLNLTIAGSGPLGTMANRIQTLPGITLRHGWLQEQEIPHLLAQSDVVVLPYIEASQSGIVPSAFASGVPAIVTPVGGLCEQVQHEMNGLITDSSSSLAIAEAIKRLCFDRDLLSSLRAGAQQTAMSDLSWKHIAQVIRDHATQIRGCA